jgi:FkbM family methyltransferase
MLIKHIIKKSFKFLGLEISKKKVDFDDIYIKKIKKNPIIFDIGANQGQSIQRFKKIFKNPTIHSFEPIKSEFNILKKKYYNDKNIILNNFAVGNKNNQKKNFYINTKTSTSSFNKLKSGTKWLKIRSKELGLSTNKFTKEIVKTNIVTIDNYCLKNNIKTIDILKIDTQGYEDKILEGARKVLGNGMVLMIEVEIMFDNVYKKYLTFSEIEKFLIHNNYRLGGINLINNNLFFNISFFADVLYFNKKKINVN